MIGRGGSLGLNPKEDFPLFGSWIDFRAHKRLRIMSMNFAPLDLALVVAIDNHNPRLLTLDFLQLSGIVPQEWELARPPVVSQQGSQLLFANGISIVAQPDRLIFLATLANSVEFAAEVAAIAQRYVQTLPNGQYQAVGVNLRGYAEGENPSRFFRQRLLQPGPWLDEGEAEVNPSLTLNYQLAVGGLTLTVTPAQLQFTEQQVVEALLFAGNYNTGLQGSGVERLQQLQTELTNWQFKWEHFAGLIQSKFLAEIDPLLGTAPFALAA